MFPTIAEMLLNPNKIYPVPKVKIALKYRHKICDKCHEQKHLEIFDMHPVWKHKRKTTCKECENASL